MGHCRYGVVVIPFSVEACILDLLECLIQDFEADGPKIGAEQRHIYNIHMLIKDQYFQLTF